MSSRRRGLVYRALVLSASVFFLRDGGGTLSAQERRATPTAIAAARADTAALRAWDSQVDQLIRTRDLRIRESARDSMLPERRHERLDQYVRGVRIFGGEVTRQLASDGTVSILGVLHPDISLQTAPGIDTGGARRAIAAAVAGQAMADPELVVLPLSDGYHLAYAGEATDGAEIYNVFVDASSGALLQRYSTFIREVGVGKGAYGDDKKVSAKSSGGVFIADDGLRPGAITTYDMRGGLARLNLILNRFTSVTASDIASDADNQWTDPTVVDAHVYSGWFYDYLYKRFGRNGLDDRNLRMAVFTHPVRLEDIGGASANTLGTYYVNAFSCSTCGPDGRGAIVFGEGTPRGFLAPGLEVKPFSAALDVVAHELTHSVIGTTSRLNGFPYSDAASLNEGFADIFGVSTAFFFQPSGNGPLQASYRQGKDLTVPAGALMRSLADPSATLDADHYTRRFVGGDPHYNGVIAGHAFYLAVEGGTNRTSGRSVQGVGAANREQIEKAFFRAVTLLMPSSSTFAMARVATIQAARDLYGSGSAAERAITQAWDAVGVQERTVPTAAILPNPATPSTVTCTGLQDPHWVVGVTASAGTSSLRITQWAFDFFDHTGKLQDHEVSSGAVFGQLFNQCGAGGDRILAQTDACTAVCIDLRGDTSGTTQVSFTALDDAGRTVVFSSPRTVLTR